MNRFVLDRSVRCAALALLAGFLCLVSVPAVQAQAVSGFSYLAADGNFQVQYTHQSTSYLKREARDNAGALIETVTCPAPIASCFPALPARTATFAVSLEGFNPVREEIVSERCNNVVSTVPQLFCVNGGLRMTLRLRTGAINATMSLLPVAPGQLIDALNSTMRMAFVEDPSRYWELPVGSRTVAPAGNHRVTSQNLRAPCQPTHTNPGAVLDIPAGGTGNVTLSYRRTLCSFTVTVQNSDTTAAGVVASVDGALACGDPNRLTNTCTGTFPADTTAHFTGSAAPGYRVQFNNNALTTFCNYPLAAPDRCDVLTTSDRSVRMEAYPGATPPPPPPPPPPVTLSMSAGASMPADRSAAKGDTNVPMLQLRATPAGGKALVHALTLRVSGNGRDDLDLPSLRVVLDGNGNGRVDAGEIVLGQGRPTVDNGSVRLGLTTPLELTSGVELLVVADIADTVHAAAAGWAGGGLALAVLGLWTGRTRRRGVVAAQLVVAAVIAACLLAACGGGGDDSAPQTAEPPVQTVPPPAVTLNYRIELLGVDATDDASPAQAVNVADLPIAGALVSVTQ